jgi:hypothetical protein
MSAMPRTAALWVLGCAIAAAPATRADMGRTCLPRPLDAQEQAAAERTIASMRAALPPAPAGWTVRDDVEQTSGTACAGKGAARAVNQPISARVSRVYLRDDAQPAAAARASATGAERLAQARAHSARAKVVAWIGTNFSQVATARGAERMDVPGARAGLRDRSSGRVLVLFGDWALEEGAPWALATLDESGATARVQNLVVEIGGDPETTGALVRAVDAARLQGLVGR